MRNTTNTLTNLNAITQPAKTRGEIEHDMFTRKYAYFLKSTTKRSKRLFIWGRRASSPT